MENKMPKKCSDCIYALVKINPRQVRIENKIDLFTPFSSASVLERIRCEKNVWQPVTSYSLFTRLESAAENCKFYKEFIDD